jgi:hypothetical protein
VVAAALLIGFGVSTWMFVRERESKREQERLRLQAQTEAAKSRQVAQFLKDMLQGVGPSVALGRDTTILREILDKAAERVGRDLTNQPTVEGALRATIGRAYHALGHYNRAESILREALVLMQRWPGQGNSGATCQPLDTDFTDSH